MFALSVDHLTYSYSGLVKQVNDVSFDVAAGTIVGLVGPNGSGKSTLVKVVLDLLAIQQGSVTLNGVPHSERGAKNAAVYLASNDYLPEFLTPREHYSLLAKLYGTELDHDAAQQLFRKFSMADCYDQLISDFSHGMRKKTQLVAALVLRRPLTIIDETLNGVDLEAMRLAERELAKLRDDGCAVLLVSHDFALLERLVDQIVFLDLGYLVARGDVGRLVGSAGSLEALVFGHLESEGR